MSNFLQFIVFVVLPWTCLSKPATRWITGTFSSTPPGAPELTTETKREGEEGATSGTYTTTTPEREVRTNKQVEEVSTSWVTGTTSDNKVVTGRTLSPRFNQQVNRPYCIINGQFFYAGPQKIYFGCFFVCECLGYGEFACSPLCTSESKPCPSNRWKKVKQGCCDEYICLG